MQNKITGHRTMYIGLRCAAHPYIKLLLFQKSDLAYRQVGRWGTGHTMNNRQFIARQRVKYIWKSLKHTNRLTGVMYRDMEGKTDAPFWEYETMPRDT